VFDEYGITFAEDDPAWIMTLINNDMTNITTKSNKKAEKILQEVKEIQDRLTTNLDSIAGIPFNDIAKALNANTEGLYEVRELLEKTKEETDQATKNLRQANTLVENSANKIMQTLEKRVPSLIEKHIDEKMQGMMKMYMISLGVVFFGTLSFGYILFGKFNFLGG